MRGAVNGMPTPHALGRHLPGLFQEDDLAQRFTAGLDDVLAPVLWVLDSLDAYLDPELAPEDFVSWLAGWVGLELDDNWPLTRRRALVRRAAELHRWRGTVRGVAAAVALYTGVEPEIDDTGGVAWSPAPGTDLPGRAPPRLVVRVRPGEGEEVDADRVERLVAAAKPAHVAHEVEVLTA